MIVSPNLRLFDGPAGVAWDEPPCPLCGGDRQTPVVEAPDQVPGGTGLRFVVARCGECRLHFTSPRPDRTMIGRFYRRDSGPRRIPPVPNGPVTLCDVLEHSHNPLALLTELRERLGTAGRLTVVVPNIHSHSFGRFGAAWVGLDLPRHLIHFSPATLRRTLERAGFRVTKTATVARPDWVRDSARWAIQAGRPTLWQRALAWKPLALLNAIASRMAAAGDEIVAVAEAAV